MFTSSSSSSPSLYLSFSRVFPIRDVINPFFVTHIQISYNESSWPQFTSHITFHNCQGISDLIGRVPLDEWSARRRYIHLTTHNIHNRQTSMAPAGFEPTISAGERPHTYALDRKTSGTVTFMLISNTIAHYNDPKHITFSK